MIKKRKRIDVSGIEFKERVVSINRVCKVVKGGKRYKFSALVVGVNGENYIGVPLDKENVVTAMF